MGDGEEETFSTRKRRRKREKEREAEVSNKLAAAEKEAAEDHRSVGMKARVGFPSLLNQLNKFRVRLFADIPRRANKVTRNSPFIIAQRARTTKTTTDDVGIARSVGASTRGIFSRESTRGRNETAFSPLLIACACA